MYKLLTAKMFKTKIEGNENLTIVKFKADWSGACQIISPVYEELSETYKNRAGFYCIEVEKNKTISKQYGIVELPTILFFRQGQVVDHSVGLVPKDVLIKKIEDCIN